MSAPTKIAGRSWIRFLAAYAVLWGVMAGLSEVDATGRWGLAILVAVAVTAVVVELLFFGTSLRAAIRFLGLGRASRSALAMAALVAMIVLLIYPVTTALTGAHISLVDDWPWIVLGLFAFHGLAEEIVWRGFIFRRLSAGRPFKTAVFWTMPFLVIAHVPMFLNTGALVAGGALAVAAVTSIPFSYLYLVGRSTIWAPAMVHTAIDTFKLVTIPATAATTFSLLLIGVSLVVPLLALVVPGRRPATSVAGDVPGGLQVGRELRQ